MELDMVNSHGALPVFICTGIRAGIKVMKFYTPFYCGRVRCKFVHIS